MNSKKKKPDIFSSSHHFTRDEMVRYARHNLSEQEQHEMEKHLVDCELCNDALKGVAELDEATVLYKISKELRRRTRRKFHSRKKIYSQTELIAIFAVVFLILFLLLMSIFFFGKK
jgi:hypothetical protein